jgi:hypothetical protein
MTHGHGSCVTVHVFLERIRTGSKFFWKKKKQLLFNLLRKTHPKNIRKNIRKNIQKYTSISQQLQQLKQRKRQPYY